MLCLILNLRANAVSDEKIYATPIHILYVRNGSASVELSIALVHIGQKSGPTVNKGIRDKPDANFFHAYD